jgi:hypothetical protein
MTHPPDNHKRNQLAMILKALFAGGGKGAPAPQQPQMQAPQQDPGILAHILQHRGG